MKKIIIVNTLLCLLIFSSNNAYSLSTVKSDKLASDNSDKWAVFITYGEPNRDKENVERLYIILVNNGWKTKNMIFLEEKDATNTGILAVPDWLNVKGLDEEDLILFYFSLHGSRKEDIPPLDESDGMDEYLITYSQGQDNQNNNILDEELASAFDKIKSKNIVMIFETCYSGGMIDGSYDLRKSGRVILTSSKEDESSYPIFLLKSWLFPHYLINGLSGKADTNSYGYVSAEEAFNYAKIRTIRRFTIMLFYFLYFIKAC